MKNRIETILSELGYNTNGFFQGVQLKDIQFQSMPTPPSPQCHFLSIFTG